MSFVGKWLCNKKLFFKIIIDRYKVEGQRQIPIKKEELNSFSLLRKQISWSGGHLIRYLKERSTRTLHECQRFISQLTQNVNIVKKNCGS